MHKLHELREKLMEELEGCCKKEGDMTPQQLDTVYKLIESVKGIDKIFMLNEEDSGYSQRYSGTRNGNGYGYSGNRWIISSNSMYPRYSRNDKKDMVIGMLEELKTRAPSSKAMEAIDTVMATIRLDD